MTPKTLHLIRQLHEDGMSYRQIARGLGLRHQNVFSAVRVTQDQRSKWDRTHYRRKCGLPTK